MESTRARTCSRLIKATVMPLGCRIYIALMRSLVTCSARRHLKTPMSPNNTRSVTVSKRVRSPLDQQDKGP